MWEGIWQGSSASSGQSLRELFALAPSSSESSEDDGPPPLVPLDGEELFWENGHDISDGPPPLLEPAGSPASAGILRGIAVQAYLLRVYTRATAMQ